MLLTDGDQPSPIFDCHTNKDREFLDYTTSAAAYHVRNSPQVLIVGAGGGADINQALANNASGILALEMNGQLIDLLRGPLAEHGGRVYSHSGVTIVNQEARAFMTNTLRVFDMIQVSLVDSFGLAGAGLQSGQEAYLFTVESFGSMLNRLNDRGILSISRWTELPPRESLKIFDTMVQAFRAMNLPPEKHVAMIRSWATVTVMGFRAPITAEEVEKIRSFCSDRGFDICFLPGPTATETNRFHRLDRPWYAEAANALPGPAREAFLADYPFQIAAATDDRPFFYHVLRLSALPVLHRQLQERVRSFIELGSIMNLFGLLQAIALSAGLIILPLLIWRRTSTLSCWDLSALTYFLFLGVGFMFLEMGFLQKLGLYLGQPVYSAAAVISGFLLFSGIGSLLCEKWSSPPRTVGLAAAALIVMVTGVYLALLDFFLTSTQGFSIQARFVLAAAAIAPLAIPLGHLFPLGFGLVIRKSAQMAPWAWGVNGFSSVIATTAVPLVAMQAGFKAILLIGMICYAIAGLFWHFQTEPGGNESQSQDIRSSFSGANGA